MHRCPNKGTHRHTHTDYKHNSTAVLLPDCYHCADPCIWESWEMSWNGLEKGERGEEGALTEKFQTIHHLPKGHLCLLLLLYKLKAFQAPPLKRKAFFKFLINVLYGQVYTQKVCIYLAPIHQSIWAHAPPHVQTIFPMDRRGVGQKFGTEGRPGLLAPCHNPGMNHLNLMLKGIFRCVIGTDIQRNVVISYLKS